MSMQTEKIIPLTMQSEKGINNARVVAVSEESPLIEIDGRTYKARIAFSCLVLPEPGDLVLYTEDNDSNLYILCIIERSESKDMAIAFPGNVNMRTEKGSLGLWSKTSMTLASEERFNCMSKEVLHKSRNAVIDYDEITARGTNLTSYFTRVKMVGHTISTLTNRMVQRAKSYFRQTADYDQIDAGQMTRTTKGLFSLDSKYSIMISKKDTKIDGERIHMG